MPFKIYGKTFPEIFAQLYWTQKVIIAAGAVFIVFALGYLPYFFFIYGKKDETPAPIVINAREIAFSVLDPSIAYDGKTPYMAYTSVTPPSTAGAPPHMGIEIAGSNKTCETWSKKITVSEGKDEDLLAADGLSTLARGQWRNETPALVYDPGDKDRPWKIFAYKYYYTGDKNISKSYAVITYRHTTDLNLSWSPEEWIFSANAAAPPRPYGGLVKWHLNDFDPSLASMSFYARPSVVEVNGALLMTLSAFAPGKDTVDRIILLMSADHGQSWKYLGTPLTHDQVVKSGGYTGLAGATLIRKKDTLYLAAVFATPKAQGAGTSLIPFTNVLKAELARTPEGSPAVVKYIPQSSVQPSDIGGGFAAYNEACDQGLFTSEFSGLVKGYRIFITYKQP